MNEALHGNPVNNDPVAPAGDLSPHRGTLILILGIGGLVCCGLLGIFAWVMGNADLRDMDEGLMDPAGRDLTLAGKICGIVGTILLCIGVGLMLLYFLIIIVAVSAGGM